MGGGSGLGGGGGGFRVDVNGEMKLLRKFKKKIFIFFGGGGVGGSGQGGRVGGQGGWERRSEACVKI